MSFWSYDGRRSDMPESDNSGSSFGVIGGIMGLSFLASVIPNSLHWDSTKIFVLGALVEMSRRLFQWVIDRFKIPYCITAKFTEGDPSYDWIILFLTQEKVCLRSRDFRVCEKNSQRKWSIKSSDIGGPEAEADAEYIPRYKKLQIFRWKGYWIEIKGSTDYSETIDYPSGGHSPSTISLAIYTLDMNVLYRLMKEVRSHYKEVTKPSVTVHQANDPNYGPGFVWTNVKHKALRPLNSVILNEGVLDSPATGVKEFINAETWYIDAEIPYRRGYLLYGPPGTGKSELGLEIYALSLSSKFVDDSFLQRAASSIPKHSIFLIEDIDCAFASREDDDEDSGVLIPGSGMFHREYMNGYRGTPGVQKSAVTLSGLLNVIDGIGSEDGKLFFATTNHIDQLDAALIRPGRIDMKIQYNHSTKSQAGALFLRFFDHPYTNSKNNVSQSLDLTSTSSPPVKNVTTEKVQALAQTFASHIPAHEFSTAELQGFLLSYKHDPVRASESVVEWVTSELAEKDAKKARQGRKEEAKRKEREERETTQTREVVGAVQKFEKIMTEAGTMVNGGE